nr:DNA internalization-related competence protein ComEC/Rec2 [Shouchella xiaoxiensis]
MLSTCAAIVLFSGKNNEVGFYFIAVAVILVLLSWRKNFRMTCFSLFFPFVLFSSVSFIHHSLNQTDLDYSQSQLAFTIQDRFHANGNFLRNTIETNTGERLVLHIYLTDQDQLEIAKTLPGQRCIASGNLKEPASSRNFDAFDYKQYLHHQRIHWIFEVKHVASFQCMDNHSLTIMEALKQFRANSIDKILEIVPKEVSGIVLSLTYGERSYLDPQVSEAYAKLGIIHLLAISGLHVGIVTACVFFLLIRIGVPREYAISSLLLFLPIFAVLSGAAPPVIRASTMAFVYFLFQLLRIPIHPFYGFSFIFFGYLMIDPYKLFQLGFQLSFLVSFSLILCKDEMMKKANHYFTRLAVVTTIAQLIGLPLILYHFYEWSPVSLLINLMYIPFISLCILPICFLIVLTVPIFPLITTYLTSLLSTIIVPVHSVILYLSDHVIVWTIGKPAIILIVAMYISIVCIGLQWERGKALYKAGISFGIILFIATYSPYLKNETVVTMIDVGQGDAFLIELPRRKQVYLIDTGGFIHFHQEEWEERNQQFDTGRDIIVPFLKAKGIDSLTGLILTHGDYDHIGGAKAVIESINTQVVYYPAVEIEKEIELDLIQTIKKMGGEFKMIKAGDRIHNDFYVIHPSSQRTWTSNDGSIVLYFVAEGKTFLLTGDLEKEGENHLLTLYPTLQADVLKVGHHGSVTSTNEAFLGQVQPKMALISAGVNNRFGHPHPDVIARLEEQGVLVLRTDQHGAVEIIIKNGKINIRKVIE